MTTVLPGAFAAAAGAAITGERPAGAARPVAFLLPGQGSQHVGMAVGLYGWEPVFTETIDEVFRLFGELGATVRAEWLGAGDDVDIDHVTRAQPLLFALDYALAAMVRGWGVRPAAMVGHSAGEVVAATHAGVFTLQEAVDMVAQRVGSAVPIPSGGMLAVAGAADELRPYLVGDVAVAAVNAGRQTMLAGSDEPLAAVAAALAADDFTVRRVPASTPFHCAAMEPAVAEAQRRFTATPRPPRMPVYSGYSGERLTERDACSARFWARQLADTVYFGPALSRLLADRDALLVETGPGQTLTAFARRHRAVRSGASAVLPLLPDRRTGADAVRAQVVAAAHALWGEGHDLTFR